MRDYAKVSPKFWIGQTCKEVRARGSEGALVALYLMTSPMSNMLGLFCQPMLYMAHETGLGLEGASKGLRACIEAGFCKYDEVSETVFVVEMASYQIAPSLKASDNRCAGIQKDYESLPDNPFLGDFFERYQRAFHLTNRRDCKGASKPLPSQEQEQEQEQEQAIEEANASLSPAAPDDAPPTDDDSGEQPDGRPPCPHERIIALYHETLPELRQVREWNETRRRLLKRRWSEQPERQNLAWWREYFGYVRGSKFLMGKTVGRDGRPFDCDLEWLVRPQNFAKVVEGKYEDGTA